MVSRLTHARVHSLTQTVVPLSLTPSKPNMQPSDPFSGKSSRFSPNTRYSRRVLITLVTVLSLAIFATILLAGNSTLANLAQLSESGFSGFNRVVLPATTASLPDLPRCSNAIIFTGARQGSTWFIDSVENCSYSTADFSGKLSFSKDVFKRTELWKHFGEVGLDGYDMEPDQALEYIVHKTSVKIFPSVFWRRREDIRHMLRQRQKYNLTILILRRDMNATYRSWLRAQTTKVWNGAVQNLSVAYNETHRNYFVESHARYNMFVERMLRKEAVPYDVFDFDTAVMKPMIVALNNGCYIRNCNFNESESDSERESGDDQVADRKYVNTPEDEAAAGEDPRDSVND